MNRIGELYELRFPNEKRYIGITCIGAQKRFKKHLGNAQRGRDLPLSKAIRKYGIDNIKCRVLVIARLDYLKELEVAAIDRYRTRDSRHGYNLSFGGDVSPTLGRFGKSHPSFGHRVTSAHKKLISQNRMGNCHWIGRKHTKETKLKMSKARKLYWKRRRKS